MTTETDERLAFLRGGGELGALIADRSWARHPLGAPSSWEPGLKAAVQIMLTSPQPTCLCWSRDKTLLFNDAFRTVLGGAYPELLGLPVQQGLAGIWSEIGPPLARVLQTGEAEVLKDSLPWCADRQEMSQVAFSPVSDDAGEVAGVFIALHATYPSLEVGSSSVSLSLLQHKLLELTLQERPLDLILDELMRAVRAVMGGDIACSILLTDEREKQLFHGAALGLPKEYTDAIDGVEIGPEVGSCGTAGYRKAPVLVADIATDPLWRNFRELALPHGLRACWSHPVIGTKGKLHGTFAIYSPRPGLPSARKNGFLDLVARITALIFERYAAQEALNDQRRLLETLNRTGAGIAAHLDHEALVQMVTDAGVELTGAQFGAFFYNVTGESGESYMLYALSGVDKSAFSDFPMPRNTKVFAPTFGGDGIVRSDDITADPRYGLNPPYCGMPDGHLPVRSYLAVPVISGRGEVLGGLFFGHEEPGRFSDHHAKLMDGIAGQASIAFDNARLYQSAQREIEVRRRAESELIRIKDELELAQERVELALAAGAIVGTWIWHIPSDTVTADERFARAFGLSPDRCHAGIPIAEATASIHPEDRERVQALIDEAVQNGGAYRAEYRARHVHGSYRWVEASGHCEHDESGRAIRFPGVLIDIEQRRRTESDLKRREADLALLLDATADGFYAVDKAGFTTRCNAAFLRMLGFQREEDVIGKQLHEIIHHSHADGSHYPRENCPIYHTAETGEMAHHDDEVFWRTDGTSFPVEYWVRPVIWQGELQGAVCNVVDISERKRAEEARQLLMRELNHRVKNLFSITAGMIKMTARHSESVEEMCGALSGRVMALARAHELISSSITARQGEEVPSRLDKLIEAVMAPHVGTRSNELEINGPEVEPGPTATTAFALILHELATNAAKYGALSTRSGKVRVTWEQVGDMLTLLWKESGGPELAQPPEHSGFGSQLARLSATGQLGGSIDYSWRRAGVEIRLTVAIDRLAQ